MLAPGEPAFLAVWDFEVGGAAPDDRVSAWSTTPIGKLPGYRICRRIPELPELSSYRGAWPYGVRLSGDLSSAPSPVWEPAVGLPGHVVGNACVGPCWRWRRGVMAAAFPEPGWSYLAPRFRSPCSRWRVGVPDSRSDSAADSPLGVAFYLSCCVLVEVIGVDAWLLLSVPGACGWRCWGLRLRRGGRLRWWPIAVAALWVLQEAVRDRVPWGGFPWGRLAFPARVLFHPIGSAGGAPW